MNRVTKSLLLFTACLLSIAGTGVGVRRLYPSLVLDDNNLHRNIISLNLLPKRLPIDKQVLLETQLKLELSTKLWSPQSEPIPTEDLALYIQALHASCIDPFDFYGMDVVQLLLNQTSEPDRNATVFERHLTSLTACFLSHNATYFQKLLGSEERLADLLGHKNSTAEMLQSLSHVTTHSKNHHPHDEPMSMNDRLMKSLALSCYARLVPNDRDIRFRLNDMMASVFLQQNRTDGSFNGNIITTSLAIQAFIDAGLDQLSFMWNRRKAVNFINVQLREMEMNATVAYFIVPAFHKTWHEIKCRTGTQQLLKSQEEEAEYARTWARALNQVLNQADTAVNVTVSRWVPDSSGKKTKVSVNIPPHGPLLRALKQAVKNTTSMHYEESAIAQTKDNKATSQSDGVGTTSDSPVIPQEQKRNFSSWFRSLMG